MGNCFFCGAEVIWEADFNGEDYGLEDEEALVGNYYCPECGAEYQVTVHSDEYIKNQQ